MTGDGVVDAAVEQGERQCALFQHEAVKFLDAEAWTAGLFKARLQLEHLAHTDFVGAELTGVEQTALDDALAERARLVVWMTRPCRAYQW